ncbi:sensor histidine kinase [Modestobacter lapidis]|nr:HAMP domain-containing histidine kinase [Modestobacter lapidis]
MTWRLRPRGLRARIVVGFAAGTLLVSAVLVATTFLLARNYLLDQRESSATRQAFTDANLLRSRLSTAGVEIGDVLADLFPAGGSAVVVRNGEAWYSSSLDVGARDVPGALQELVAGGAAGTVRIESATGPRLVVGVAVPAAGIEFFEVAPLTELQLSLRTLAAVLGAGALAATAAGAAFGTWASRRAVHPLEQVAGAATSIAGGELTTRLPSTDDPDLVAIVGSFNSMVDALAARIDRDARFVGDVSHELRSPLTTLTTSVEVMGARREELSPRGREALTLIEAELRRFRRTLDDLLELARLDADATAEPLPPVSLGQVVREVLAHTGRPADLLTTDGDAPTTVRADKSTLERAVVNLLDNADRHAGGARRVMVQQRDGAVVLHVDDAGPGVAPADRERVFERFARGARTARGSLPGAGLGLAIVAETAARHGGAAWCSASPDGGARFSLALPGVRP